MTAPASDDLRELERELAIASDSGETRSLNDLRENFPDWSREDLLGALGTLREHGKAVEDAPGDWRAPSDGEVREAAEPPRVQVTVGDEDEPVAGDEDGAGVDADAYRAAMRGQGRHAAMVQAGLSPERGPTVRLTRAVADALEADALGQIVKAAINSMEEHEVFIFEVTP